jgi:hypothetical protein
MTASQTTASQLAKFTVTNAHGTFTTVGSGLDLAMLRYLPASPDQLREVMSDATGLDYSDIHSVSEFLIMLADADPPAVRHRPPLTRRNGRKPVRRTCPTAAEDARAPGNDGKRKRLSCPRAQELAQQLRDYARYRYTPACR